MNWDIPGWLFIRFLSYFYSSNLIAVDMKVGSHRLVIVACYTSVNSYNGRTQDSFRKNCATFGINGIWGKYYSNS